MDLYLDPATHDLVLGDGAAPALIYESRQAVAQRIKVVLETQRGEWRYDTRFGVRWRELAYVKNPDIPRLSAEIRRVVGAVQGVTSVVEVDIRINRATRALTIGVQARTNLGDVAAVGDTVDFSRPLFLLYFLGVEGAAPGLAP